MFKCPVAVILSPAGWNFIVLIQFLLTETQLVKTAVISFCPKGDFLSYGSLTFMKKTLNNQFCIIPRVIHFVVTKLDFNEGSVLIWIYLYFQCWVHKKFKKKGLSFEKIDFLNSVFGNTFWPANMKNCQNIIQIYKFRLLVAPSGKCLNQVVPFDFIPQSIDAVREDLPCI